MLNRIGKFLARRVLPLIASELDFSFKTVEREDGYYFLILITAFNFVLLEREIKFSSQTSASIAKNERLTLDQPIDISRKMEYPAAQDLPESFKRRLNKKAKQTFE